MEAEEEPEQQGATETAPGDDRDGVYANASDDDGAGSEKMLVIDKPPKPASAEEINNEEEEGDTDEDDESESTDDDGGDAQCGAEQAQDGEPALMVKITLPTSTSKTGEPKPRPHRKLRELSLKKDGTPRKRRSDAILDPGMPRKRGRPLKHQGPIPPRPIA